MDLSNLPAILTPDIGLLVWMLIAFAVVFLILSKFGFPVIINMVDKRNKFISESLEKAKEASARIENIKEEGETLLQEAREKQAAIIKEAVATRDAIVANAQDKAKEESLRLINEAKAEIELQKKTAISDIRRQVTALSVEISEKILREKLNTDKAQMDYIDRMLDEVTSNK